MAEPLELQVGRKLTGVWIARHEPGRALEIRTSPPGFALVLFACAILFTLLMGPLVAFGAWSDNTGGGVMAILFCTAIWLGAVIPWILAVRRKASVEVGRSIRGMGHDVLWEDVVGARAHFFNDMRGGARRTYVDSMVILAVLYRPAANADLACVDVYSASMGTQLARARAESLVAGLNDALRGMGLGWSDDAQALYEREHPAPSPESQLPLGYGALSKAMGYDMNAQQEQMHAFAVQLGLGYRPVDTSGVATVSGEFRGVAVVIDWQALTAFDTKTRLRATFASPLGIGLSIRQGAGSATGDATFDGWFDATARDDAALRHLLGAEARQQLLAAVGSGAEVTVDDEGVSYLMSGALKDVQRVGPILEHLVGLTSTLHAAAG